MKYMRFSNEFCNFEFPHQNISQMIVASTKGMGELSLGKPLLIFPTFIVKIPICVIEIAVLKKLHKSSFSLRGGGVEKLFGQCPFSLIIF